MILENGMLKVEYKNNEWFGFYNNKAVANLKSEDWENEFVNFNSFEAGNIFIEGLKEIEKDGFYKTALDPMTPNAPPVMAPPPPMDMATTAPPPMDMAAAPPMPMDMGGDIGGQMPTMPTDPNMSPDTTNDIESQDKYVPGLIPLEVSIAGMKIRLDGMLMMIDKIKKLGNISQEDVGQGNDIMQALEEDFVTVAESFKEDLSSLYEKIVTRWKEITSNNMVNKFNQEMDKNVNTSPETPGVMPEEMNLNPQVEATTGMNEQKTEVPVYQIKPNSEIRFNDTIRKNASFSLSLKNNTVEYVPSMGVYGYQDNKEVNFWNIAKMNDFYRERLDGGDDEILAEFLDEIAGTNIAMNYGTEIGKTANKKQATALDTMSMGKEYDTYTDQMQLNNMDNGSSTSVKGDDKMVGRDDSYKDMSKRRKKYNEQKTLEILDQLENKRQHGVSIEEAKNDMESIANKNKLLKIAENKISQVFDSVINEWKHNISEGKKGKEKKNDLEETNNKLFKDIESGNRGDGVDHSYDGDCCGARKPKFLVKTATSKKTIMTFSKKELNIDKDSHYGKTNNRDNDHELHRLLRRKIAEKLIKIGSPDFTIIDVKDAKASLLIEVLVFDNKHEIKAKSYRNRVVNNEIGMSGVTYCPINGNLPTKLCSVCSLAGNPDTYIKDGMVECHADEIPEYLRNKGY